MHKVKKILEFQKEAAESKKRLKDARDEKLVSLLKDEISKQIDEQVRSIVKKCYEETLDLVAKNRAAMDKLVEILIDGRTGSDFFNL